MSFFKWEDRYDLGIEAMNSEHKTLIEKMNTLHDLNDKGAAKDQILAAFDDFASFTVKHFNDEELYMESINFPDINNHKIQHKDVLSKVGQFAEDYKNSGDDKIGDQFFSFLSLWLSSHICVIDMKYGKHANQK